MNFDVRRGETFRQYRQRIERDYLAMQSRCEYLVKHQLPSSEVYIVPFRGSFVVTDNLTDVLILRSEEPPTLVPYLTAPFRRLT